MKHKVPATPRTLLTEVQYCVLRTTGLALLFSASVSASLRKVSRMWLTFLV